MNEIVYNLIHKLKSNPLAKQSLITMFLRIFGVLFLFGLTLFLTRNYDSKLVGQYDFIRTYLLVVSALCLVGTDQSILYYAGLVKNKYTIKDLKAIYLKKVTLVIITSLLWLVFVFFLGEKFISDFFNDPYIYPIFFKATLILVFYSLTVLNTETFRALDRIYTAELFRNIFKYFSLAIGAVYLIQIGQENSLVESFLLGFILLFIISFMMIINKFNQKIKEENCDTDYLISYKEIIYRSYPMAISGMAFFLLSSFDIIFLKKYYGNETVAYYSTAIKIMSIVSMFVVSVNISVSSKIAEYYYSNNIAELKKTLKNAARLIFLFTLPIAVIICLFSKSILSVFGQGYDSANIALIILMIAILFGSLFGTAFVYLNMTGRQKLFQYIIIFAVVINFFLNKYLVPKYGIIGASLSFLASIVFWNVTAAVLIYRKDKTKVFLH